MFEISPEVGAALSEGRPLVALESTLISHGLPAPKNLEVAREMEAAVRAAGAVPATIAILDGRIKVGLTSAELERLAGPDVDKCGMADLALCTATGRAGATTVSATAWIAVRCGFRLFATGGIGGVHRGDSGDVSSDLLALSNEPICVVSSGAKLILDLPRTVEMLDSLGVLVIGYQTDDFPAFYCRSSGLRVPHRLDDFAKIAQVLDHRFERLAQGGVLLCNPIPEANALPFAEVERHVEEACAEAERQKVGGKALTPFLLSYMAKKSGLDTVSKNQALAVNNARVAAGIAVEYAKIEGSR